jgi:hypothetical protein
MDPKRLLTSDATDFERNLLDAVLKERPAAELAEGMRQALGLPEAATAALAAKTTFLTWGKATMLAAVTAGGLAVGTLTLEEEKVWPAVVAPQAAAPQAREPVPEPPAPAEASPPVEEKRPARAASGQSELREEIRMLDQVRAQIRSGSPKRALVLLATYGERFPKGAFRQEASVLRMEALASSGDKARASALANKFLADHPKSPHVERVRRIAR